jgi:hypothetical protein
MSVSIFLFDAYFDAYFDAGSCLLRWHEAAKAAKDAA